MERMTQFREEPDTCPRCGAKGVTTELNCTACNVDGRMLPSYLYRSLRTRQRLSQLTVYMTAAIYFALGLLEGFLSNSSISMAANLVVALVMLSLIPRSLLRPAQTMLLILTLNVFSQLALPFMELVPLDRWVVFKTLLILLPLLSMSIILASRFGSARNR